MKKWILILSLSLLLLPFETYCQERIRFSYGKSSEYTGQVEVSFLVIGKELKGDTTGRVRAIDLRKLDFNIDLNRFKTPVLAIRLDNLVFEQADHANRFRLEVPREGNMPRRLPGLIYASRTKLIAIGPKYGPEEWTQRYMRYRTASNVKRVMEGQLEFYFQITDRLSGEILGKREIGTAYQIIPMGSVVPLAEVRQTTLVEEEMNEELVNPIEKDPQGSTRSTEDSIKALLVPKRKRTAKNSVTPKEGDEYIPIDAIIQVKKRLIEVMNIKNGRPPFYFEITDEVEKDLILYNREFNSREDFSIPMKSLPLENGNYHLNLWIGRGKGLLLLALFTWK